MSVDDVTNTTTVTVLNGVKVPLLLLCGISFNHTFGMTLEQSDYWTGTKSYDLFLQYCTTLHIVQHFVQFLIFY